MLHRISKTTIAKWQPPYKEPWELIDPYSSLEDVGDTTSDEIEHETTEHTTMLNTVDLPHDPGCNVELTYNLRERSSRRHNPRPRRSHSLNINYNVNIPFKDVPLSPVRPSKKHKPIPHGPSLERMSAQGKHTEAPIVSHPIKHRTVLKAKQA